MRKLTRFEKISLAVILGLAIIFAGLWLTSRFLGVRLPSVTDPQGQPQIGGRGPVVFRFANDMNRSSVEASIQFIPQQSGRWEWINDREAYFYPGTAFTAGTTVLVRFAAGMSDQSGSQLNADTESAFVIRPAQIVYIGNPNRLPELWSILAQSNAQPKQLTNTGGKVYDYAISPDGQKILYSRVNFRGGTELVVIDRDGSNEKVLLDCGEESCVQPAWADNIAVAYSHFDSQAYSSLNITTAQLYSINTNTGSNGLIFTNPGVYGINPKFSPDGNSLGYYDAGAGGIRLVNLQDGSSQVIPTQVSVMGSWSPDGASLIYTELSPEAFAPYLSLYKVNLVDQSITSLTPDSTQLLDFSLPEYSADGQNLVVGVRSVNNQSYKQLWLLDAAGNFQQAITAEPMLAHASYHWAPSGDWLVYQQIDLSQKNNDPEVVLWNRSSDAYIALVKAAALPEWLP